MAAETGSIAPDFTLPNQDREPVTLSKQRGRPTVLAFFPAAFSSVCQKELCTFRDALAQLNKVNAQVYGISVDTFFSLKAFADQQHLTFPLLSDPTREVHALYGTYGEKKLYGRVVHGVIRATFVLDEQGRIALPLYNIKATGHVAMLRRKLGLAA